MPTFVALFLSSVASYLPWLVFGDSLSASADIILSLIIGTVSYAGILWYMKRLRGDL